MNEDFILYKKEGRIKASIIQSKSWPQQIALDNNKYTLSNRHLGDYNHLLNTKRELIGFEFPYCSVFDKAILNSTLITQTDNAKIDGHDVLHIILTPDNSYRSDGVLGICSRLYCSDNGELMIAAPLIKEWGNLWTNIAFPTSNNDLKLIDS